MVIPLIVGGLHSIKKYKTDILRFINLGHDASYIKSQFNFISRTNTGKNFDFLWSSFNINKFSIFCTQELISFSEFKDSIEKLFKDQNTANIISLIDDNNFTKLVINMNNENNTLSKIYEFIRAVNENQFNLKSSAILNNLEVKDDINGKKIHIVSSNICNKELKINIFIPNKRGIPIEIEYVKPVECLSKQDLISFSNLLKPSSFIHKAKSAKNATHIVSSPGSYNKLVKLDLLYNNLLDNFEDFWSNRNLSNSTDVINYALSKSSNDFRDTDFRTNLSGKEFLNEFNETNIDNSNIISGLEDLGVKVYVNKPNDVVHNDPWNSICGYEDVKKQIEEHILLHFKHPEILEKIINGTRMKNDSNNRPRLILFEGPPGTGKTTSARIIGEFINVPLIYVSLENIVSKWFGESETKLSKVFDLAKNFSEGCVIFIDEVDTMAMSRDKIEAVHEGSKKILSVLLRKLDGFDTLDTKTLVICATNRKKDLDSAFISRIDSTVYFPLPSEKERELIFRQYAKHLTRDERMELAKISGKLSGRSIRHVCLEAEREWASFLIKEKTKNGLNQVELPKLKIYKNAIKKRCL
ncbi:CDC48 like AAA ATPase [Cryptosporidium ryanae]|uniref:CDC48 like AAA ATPase n=1 Tax=Cryptosporidium ryanae TaxID=515981 RepID=UPI00351AA8F3|nr:CDC48 like AAA ATPase [Cryptosporidium ryanae]